MASVGGVLRNAEGRVLCFFSAFFFFRILDFIVFGPAAESFQRIPSYFYMLEQKSPGTMTDFKLDDEGRFEFSFFSYGAFIHGFRSAIRHVIAIDGTRLKGIFRGILFVAKIYAKAWLGNPTIKLQNRSVRALNIVLTVNYGIISTYEESGIKYSYFA
ncbi:hypothetical protein Dsin_023179 [Dipteronia sinensis]|uniref:Uncharacterized protein n=1 Tax=Dipteronia sinensis TaxID=43782 RepID=A0AAE0E0T0_9ROSI|nr:hypothetical protein Dsin_023179 [Dipteronia sinensis]